MNTQCQDHIFVYVKYMKYIIQVFGSQFRSGTISFMLVQIQVCKLYSGMGKCTLTCQEHFIMVQPTSFAEILQIVQAAENNKKGIAEDPSCIHYRPPVPILAKRKEVLIVALFDYEKCKKDANGGRRPHPYLNLIEVWVQVLFGPHLSPSHIRL